MANKKNEIDYKDATREIQFRASVMLTDTRKAQLFEAGNGNVSKGIREVLKFYIANKPKK